MLSFLDNLGQGFIDLVSGIKDYFLSNILIGWLPVDIQLAIFAVMVVLLIVAIKRAVLA